MEDAVKSLTDFASYLSIGGVFILGLYLIMETKTLNISKAINSFGGGSSWSVLIALPFATISYVIGLSLSNLGYDLLNFFHITNHNKAEFIIISAYDVDAVTNQYLELKKKTLLLSGCAISFFALASGFIKRSCCVTHLRGILIASGIISILLTVLTIVYFYSNERSLIEFVTSATQCLKVKATP